jgi:cytoskeletal protein RodZ
MVFVMRKLDRTPATLGEKLRGLRRGQAVTLEMLVARTQIQKKYLQALEKGAYESLPEPLYTRQFVRMYASVLGADVKYFLELYDEECGRCDLLAPMQAPRQRLRKHFLMSWNLLSGYIFIGLAILGIFIYIISQMAGVFLAPSLTIEDPSEAYVITSQATVPIRGTVEDGGTVLINGQTVPTNEQNQFSVDVPLERGINKVIIEAIRRYSAHTKVERTVLYEDSSTGGDVQ